jgi:hypothetical protein
LETISKAEDGKQKILDGIPTGLAVATVSAYGRFSTRFSENVYCFFGASPGGMPSL